MLRGFELIFLRTMISDRYFKAIPGELCANTLVESSLERKTYY